jgi:integrase
MIRSKLTAVKVANAKPDPTKRIEISDAGKPGLYLVVQPNGRKSWAVRYRRLSDRAPRKLTLEGFPSLATAHKLAQAALDKVAEGMDPAAEKRVARQAPRADSKIVEDAFGLFLDKYIRTKGGRPIRETTRRETARLLGFKRNPKNPTEWMKSGGGAVSRWQGRTLQSIRPADVRDLLDELAETGPVMANRTLAALKTCFTWHVKRDADALPRSPCEGIDDPSPESPRERALTDLELAALWRAADVNGYPFGRMVQVLILTGCRRDEVREARWAEIDLESNRS